MVRVMFWKVDSGKRIGRDKGGQLGAGDSLEGWCQEQNRDVGCVPHPHPTSVRRRLKEDVQPRAHGTPHH